MVAKSGGPTIALCFAANFAKDLRMDAKARKREKRRAAREALRTMTAKQAAQGADTAAQDADVWGEPYVRPEPTKLLRWEDTPRSSGDVDAEFQQYLCDILQQSFAASVTQLLEVSGLAPLGDKEYEMVSDTLVIDILPAMEQKVREARQVEQQQDPATSRLGSQRGTLMEGAGTQDEGEASQGGLQQGAAVSIGLLVGQDEAASANGLTGEEPDALWAAAFDKARLEGGDDSTVRSNTVKMYRGLKRRLKSKQKKKLVVAA